MHTAERRKRTDEVVEEFGIHLAEFRRNRNETKIVVVLIGWLGSKERYINKYVEVYHKYGISTITFLRNSLFFERKKEKEIASFLKLLKKSTREENSIILFHVFSTHGFRKYGEILKAMQKDKKLSVKLKSVVFDSAPPLTTISGMARAYSGLLVTEFRNRLRITENKKFYYHWLFYPIFFVVSMFLFYCCCIYRKPRLVYNEVLRLNAVMKIPVCFVYSEMDFSVPPKEVEAFIEKQKKLSDALVVAKKFKDTYHVSHARKHPKEYWKAIQKFYQDTTDEDILKDYNNLFDD